MGRLFIKVNLRIVHEYDVGLTKIIPDYDGLLRIFYDMRFKTPSNWTEAEYAIVDTGAFIILLPLSLWKELDINIIADYFVRGLVPKKDCMIKVKVGWIKGKIIDGEGNSTSEIRFRAYLALADNIPLIVGFKDLLERYCINIDTPANRAFIETKKAKESLE